MIVLDSSFLIAFHNERDSRHAAAALLMERFLAGEWGKGILLEYVFLEVVTVLMVRRDVATAARAGAILLNAQELEFMPCADFFDTAFEIFSQQSGTRLSLTDVAIAFMAEAAADGLVLTFDRELSRFSGIRVPD